MGSQVLSLKYDMDTNMTTSFEGEDRDLYWELDRATS